MATDWQQLKGRTVTFRCLRGRPARHYKGVFRGLSKDGLAARLALYNGNAASLRLKVWELLHVHDAAESDEPTYVTVK